MFKFSLFRKKINSAEPQRSRRGQSFVELALILPVLLLMLLGMIEIVIFIGRYLDILDLSREAARFASVRDPFDFNVPRDKDCRTPGLFDFFFDTSCVFSPPAGSPSCTDLAFCNGLNSFVVFNPATDDIVISIYTVSGGNVTDVWPQAGKAPPPVSESITTGYWAFSNQDADTAHNDNWKRDCQGNPVQTEPYYNMARVQASIVAGAPPTKGFVAVEFYYCYNQVLGVPIVSQFIPNPMRIHAYTLMPLPAAAPTATPTTTPNP